MGRFGLGRKPVSDSGGAQVRKVPRRLAPPRDDTVFGVCAQVTMLAIDPGITRAE